MLLNQFKHELEVKYTIVWLVKRMLNYFKYLYIDTNRLLLQLKKPSNHLLFRNKYYLIQSTQFKKTTQTMALNLNNPESVKSSSFHTQHSSD